MRGDNGPVKKSVYIYSPSGAVQDKVAFKRGVRRLTQLGYAVEVDADALTRFTRFAGDDDTRLRSITRACASGADVALISRGGYGLTRILDRIAYAEVAHAIDGGMHFVGISDFTAFQSAVLAQTGRCTWAGPALCEGFGVGGADGLVPDDIMEDCFQDLMLGQGEGAGWRQDASGYLPADDTAIATDAILWGGNLTVLTSLLGTPFFPQVDGGVLFLEDVGEHPYRVERMLTQLLRAGVLGRQRAIVLGQFTGYRLVGHDRGFKMARVVEWIRTHTTVPVLTNLPYGHVQTKVLLPVGAQVDLALSGRDAMLFWGHALPDAAHEHP
ncbi:MAG: LD-carboxypeptidase [Rhodoferax sp.]|nr:LD-carboxypeptidase [Rhodoferax sp.]